MHIRFLFVIGIASMLSGNAGEASALHRNHLKNREFGKKTSLNSCLERVTIAERQGTSEDENSEAKPTQSKPDSSSSFGMILHDDIALITDAKYSANEIQHLIEKNFGTLKEIDIDSSAMASHFHADPCLSGESLPFSVFLHSDIEIPIEWTTSSKNDRHAVHIIYPEAEKESDWVFDTGAEEISLCFADNPSSENAHLFFINSPFSSLIEPFYQLPLDDKEQKLIHELIRTMAEKNIWGLLFKKKELEKIGKKINHVHPMRFIGYILADSKLKKCLKEIKSSSFKWDHFIDGFSNRMKEENAKNNVMPYIPGMAHLLNINQDHIVHFIHHRDYIGLVKSLI